MARLHGRTLLGVKVSPAIVSPDKKSLWYYTQENGNNQDGDNFWTERKLCGVKLANETTCHYNTDNGDLRIKFDVTLYVLHHPKGMSGFWKCGPIEKRRGRGFARTVKKHVLEAFESIGKTALPPPSELTVIAATTNIVIKRL